MDTPRNDTSGADALLQEQIDSNRLELAQKTDELFNTRLDILKSQGGENWEPTPIRARTTGVTGLGVTPRSASQKRGAENKRTPMLRGK